MDERLAELEKKLKEMTFFLVAILFCVGVVFGFTFKKLNQIHDDVKSISDPIKTIKEILD